MSLSAALSNPVELLKLRVLKTLLVVGIALPELAYFTSGAQSRSPDVSATALVALISNPVYIVCLWGFPPHPSP